MANLSVIGGHSVNGVAKLHTEILKNTVLRDFYAISPEKFNNKTNGVSHRRFLLQSNPGLSRYIAERVGDGWAAGFADAFAANLAGATADDKDVVILWRLTLDHFVEDDAEFLSDIFNLKHGNPSFLFHH